MHTSIALALLAVATTVSGSAVPLQRKARVPIAPVISSTSTTPVGRSPGRTPVVPVAPSTTSSTTSRAPTSPSSVPVASSSSATATVTSSSTSASPSPTTYDPNSFIGLSLSAHNNERAKHGANPLVWNATLAAAAQTWANKCVFQHSGGTLPIGQYGENLAAIASSGTVTAADEVALWVAEAPDYTPSDPNYSHWTQLVWKATTQLGCAVQACEGIFPANYPEAQYYVCEYQPPGNVYPASNFLINVQP